MLGPGLARGSSSSFHKHVFRLLKPVSVKHLFFVFQRRFCSKPTRLLPRSKHLFAISLPAIFFVPFFLIHPQSYLDLRLETPH